MNTAIQTASPANPTLKAPFVARRAMALLQRLQVGVLTVALPDGSQHRYGQPQPELGASVALHAHLHLNNWNPLSAALKSGDLGFDES